MTDPKPFLTQSMLSSLFDCGIRFERRYVKREILPPNTPMLIGTAVHKAAERTYRVKLDTDRYGSVEEARDVANDAVEAAWAEGVMLSEIEFGTGAEKAKGRAKDTAIGMARVHAEKIAPKVEPRLVEPSFRVELPDYPMDLEMIPDIVTMGWEVRDLKTKIRKPSSGLADESEQMSAYTIGARAIAEKYGHPFPDPCPTVLDFLWPDKSWAIQTETQTSVRTEIDIQVFLRRFEAACRVVESGIFLPANRGSWWCGPKWCGYAMTCPYWCKRATIYYNRGVTE